MNIYIYIKTTCEYDFIIFNKMTVRFYPKKVNEILKLRKLETIQV